MARPNSRQPMPHQRKPMKQDPKVMLFQLTNDVRSLNASVMLLSQKMRHIIRNEKILGRNLVVLYKRVKEFEAMSGKGELPANLSERLDAMEKKLQDISERTAMLNSDIATLKSSIVTEEQLKELKYVIDAINPLEYVTIEQARQMIDERIQEALAKKPQQKK